MEGITTVSAILVAVLAVLAAFRMSAREGYVSFACWSLVAIAVVYGMAWAMISGSLVNASSFPSIYGRVSLKIHRLYSHALNVCAFVACFLVGWWLVRKRDPLAPRQSDQAVRYPITFLFLVLGFSFLMQLLYTTAYGGLGGVFRYNHALRAGIFEIQNPLSFLKPLAGFCFMTTVAFFGIVLDRHRSLSAWLGFLLSAGLSIYTIALWAGRLNALAFAACIPLSYVLYRRIRPQVLLTGVLGGAVFAAPTLVFIGNLIGRGNRGIMSLTQFVTEELTFPFANWAQWTGADFTYRWFQDIYMAPLYFLPSTWRPFVNDPDVANTAMIIGVPKMAAGNTTGVPIDAITLGYIQAGVFGVIVFGFIVGLFFAFLQNLVYQIPWRGVRAAMFAYVSLTICFTGLFYAGPTNFVGGHIFLWLFLPGLLVWARLFGAARVQARRRV